MWHNASGKSRMTTGSCNVSDEGDFPPTTPFLGGIVDYQKRAIKIKSYHAIKIKSYHALPIKGGHKGGGLRQIKPSKTNDKNNSLNVYIWTPYFVGSRFIYKI
jgi:hypothetical protein